MAPPATIRPPRPQDGPVLEQLGLAGERVVLVLEDGPDGVRAATAVRPARVELVGGQDLYLYAAAATGLLPEEADRLLSATYAALDAEHEPGRDGEPIGLCLLIADRAEMRRRPQAQWEDPPMLYVGYLGDRRQVRVAYFEGALLRPPVTA